MPGGKIYQERAKAKTNAQNELNFHFAPPFLFLMGIDLRQRVF